MRGLVVAILALAAVILFEGERLNPTLGSSQVASRFRPPSFALFR